MVVISDGEALATCLVVLAAGVDPGSIMQRHLQNGPHKKHKMLNLHMNQRARILFSDDGNVQWTSIAVAFPHNDGIWLAQTLTRGPAWPSRGDTSRGSHCGRCG